MLELILGIVLATAATYFVLLPILRPAVESAGAPSADEGEDAADDMSPQTVALRALKEIEFDRATGKLSDADYEQLKAKYTAEALAAMRGEGAGYAARGEPDFPKQEMPAPPPPPRRAPLTAHRAHCPEHGARPEPDAAFCSECGRRLGTAPGYCVRCGTALATDARY